MTVAMDAMAVAIHIKYALSLNRHLTFYSCCLLGRMKMQDQNALLSSILDFVSCAEEATGNRMHGNLRAGAVPRTLLEEVTSRQGPTAGGDGPVAYLGLAEGGKARVSGERESSSGVQGQSPPEA